MDSEAERYGRSGLRDRVCLSPLLPRVIYAEGPRYPQTMIAFTNGKAAISTKTPAG